MLSYFVVVAGDPQGKGRPRFSSRGGFVKAYTPAKTKNYEDTIRESARATMQSNEPLKTPVSVYLTAVFPVPKSYSKKRTEDCLEGLEKPIKKPDIDNLAKSVLDGMNGVIFKDDSQIVSLHCTKVYSSGAGVDVMVKEELE